MVIPDATCVVAAALNHVQHRLLVAGGSRSAIEAGLSDLGQRDSAPAFDRRSRRLLGDDNTGVFAAVGDAKFLAGFGGADDVRGVVAQFPDSNRLAHSANVSLMCHMGDTSASAPVQSRLILDVSMSVDP